MATSTTGDGGIFLNDAAANFGLINEFATDEDTRALIVGNFDADANLEALTLSGTTDHITVLDHQSLNAPPSPSLPHEFRNFLSLLRFQPCSASALVGGKTPCQAS